MPKSVYHVFPTVSLQHKTDGSQCWCGAERRCAVCHEMAPCTHGVERSELVIHKQDS